MHWSEGFGKGNSKCISEFEEAFAEYCGAKYAIALTNGGAALELALRCLDLEPGDEVIVPAFNYKASQMAILDRGGKVVFCDIDSQTLNIDLADVESRITDRTRAICPVNQTGLAAPIDELLAIAERNPHSVHGALKIIGDAARSCGEHIMAIKFDQKNG